ncbi:putative bifunctional diguanylate cyclase/phosphodiesterase [Massilia sp. DWR3-1-1]|uniref:putative bifunctional diguanylate cyclase/phosphodiesterase n=1 Tax=Massilia sp. DWR3-1-1 TaxID=2804559 RepID=UPI003CECC96D
MQTSTTIVLDTMLLDHLPAGVVVHDKDSAIVAANLAAQRLLGRGAAELRGKVTRDPVWHFIHPDGTPMAVDEFPAARTLRERSAVTDLVLGVRQGGAIRWLICNAYPVFDAHGALHSAVVCFTDCTALKTAEQALQRSEQRLQLVLRGSDEASWDWDLVTQQLYYSPRWWDMLGYPADALPASPQLWSSLVHAGDRDRVDSFLKNILTSGESSYAIEFSMRHRQGHYVPVLSKGFIVRDGAGAATRVAGTNTDLTERKDLERRLTASANHDYLTGLPNRRFLQDRLALALAAGARTGHCGSLLVIDLDYFKTLNDTEGHDVGDLLLQQVAQRLRASVGASAFVGRLGGDEFIVILDAAWSCLEEARAEAARVCASLTAVLSAPYRLDRYSHSITPSMGVTLFDGAAGSSPDSLFKQADIALYEAKAAGRNTVRFFDQSMQQAVERRAELTTQLGTAIEAAQFELYFQAQFDLQRHVVGAEALLRWHHPRGALVSPGAFIEVAEATGLIVPIGDWVLRQASACLAQWARDPRLSLLTLSINVSAHQLRQPDFARHALALLAEAGADPRRLVLELTESALVDNVEQTLQTMLALQRGGLHFAIDDFGIGFSSLSYIHRFPLVSLKIDQSFVRDCDSDPKSAAIVEIIIAFARKLGLQSTAEGVETESQLAVLHAAGCTALQGYLLARPMPLAQFEQLVAADA